MFYTLYVIYTITDMISTLRHYAISQVHVYNIFLYKTIFYHLAVYF